jgi:nitrite reductase/ring-hydroxylating ferredoxin subunit
MSVRVALTREQHDEIARGRFIKIAVATFEVPPSKCWPPGLPMRAKSVLVGRAGARLVAYANVCRHQAVPLDFGMDTAMADDGLHLLCHQHGALYRPEDGVCIAGPCKGEALVALGVTVDGDEIEIAVP